MRKKRILSEEHKKKIGLAQLGRKKKFSQQAVENIRLAAAKRKGTKIGPMSEDHKKKISISTTGVKKTITKDNPGYFKKGIIPKYGFKKGSTPPNKGKFLSEERSSKKYKLFKEEVLKRDLYKCRHCGETAKLHVHHIKPWRDDEKLRMDFDNVITLCNSCHSKIEGTLNKYRDVFSEFRKGHVVTQETRDKISKTLVSKNLRGEKAALYGKKMSDESKNKMREAKLGYIPWNKGKIKDIPEKRVCIECKIEKPITDFTKQGRLFRHTCKLCRNRKLDNCLRRSNES